MGLVEGPHHLDAKALIRAEKHRVADGASRSAPLLGSHAGPRMPATWGVIGSVATALGVGYFGEIRQEVRPQLLLSQSLLIAGSNGVGQSNSLLVYWARQVVCRPENHA
jgi:hypothetical protein